jgi:two-component system phosphate regulon sensor histidine kinase PhoR
MIILDLKTLLFIVIIGLLACGMLIDWWIRQRRPTGPTLGRDAPLMTVLEDAPFGVLVLEDAVVHYANPYSRHVLRLAEGSGPLPDTDWAPLLEDDRMAARPRGRGLRAEGDTAHPQGRGLRGGERALEDKGSEQRAIGRYRTVTFASGRTARWWVVPWDTRDFIFLLDITTQQRTEHAARLLVNDLSHELRTPIATLLTHLEILGLDDIGEASRQQSLALSKAEAQRMARLIDDMLELGRLEIAPELPRRPLDLLALVEDVILQTTPRAAERQMALSLEASSPLPLVLGNADRLRQVFLNLLDNALKYARPGDRVVVSLQRAEVTREVITRDPTAREAIARDAIACAVCDTGPGIPSEHLPHVTRRFYRAAPQRAEGSGLGLALVAEILRRHESRLEIESQVEEESGTCVRFALPIAEATGT